jgi:hypothetical protein
VSTAAVSGNLSGKAEEEEEEEVDASSPLVVVVDFVVDVIRIGETVGRLEILERFPRFCCCCCTFCCEGKRTLSSSVTLEYEEVEEDVFVDGTVDEEGTAADFVHPVGGG